MVRKFKQLKKILCFDLDGGICNMVYYKHPLSPEQIALSYNTMALSNLPVPRKKKE